MHCNRHSTPPPRISSSSSASSRPPLTSASSSSALPRPMDPPSIYTPQQIHGGAQVRKRPTIFTHRFFLASRQHTVRTERNGTSRVSSEALRLRLASVEPSSSSSTSAPCCACGLAVPPVCSFPRESAPKPARALPNQRQPLCPVCRVCSPAQPPPSARRRARAAVQIRNVRGCADVFPSRSLSGAQREADFRRGLIPGWA